MADESFEEPFDSGSHARTPSSTPRAPPSFAFDHSNNIMPAVSGSAPPPAAFAGTMLPPGGGGEDEDELGAIPMMGRNTARSREPTIMSTELNDRWKQYETPPPAVSQAPAPIPGPQTGSDLGPRQPYSFRKSPSYDTDELIRKYGGMAGIPPVAATTPRREAMPSPTVSTAPKSPADVRDRAQKMLALVDDYSVRRTESGGFRAAPPVEENEEEPYSFRRSASGRRVPSALAGLDFSSKPQQPTTGRVSFSDPSFRDDDHISDDEDSILRSDGGFQDEPIVDVVGMENRAAGARPYSDKKNFEGDFEGGSKTWSSRYSDNPYVSRNHVAAKWDREFDQTKDRKSARNMFMSTASEIRSSASNVFKGATGQKENIFGSGGFSFRANHVFGNHRAASERDEVNLRTAWREVDDPINTPPVHKTWQEVMLNKRKRRRILCVILLLVLGSIAAVSALTAIKNAKARSYEGLNIGQAVTIYVTSDAPYDAAAESHLEKDLINIPIDSEFVFHLGNIQDASVTLCPKSRYSDVASILKRSPVPLFIVPGSEDWAKCPDPEDRMGRWMESFADFDLTFKHGLDVKRDSQNNEAFTFLHKGVLFMGLHIVSGPVIDDEAWADREKEMLKFYFGMANRNKGSFRNIVLFGNARPSPQQKDFFDALLSNLKAHHGPLIYIHAGERGDGVRQYNPFADHKEVQVIAAPDGNSNEPLRLTVGFGEFPIVIG